MHNDTHKYLFLDNKADINNNIYCVREPEVLTIRHKNHDIGRDNFKVKDDIILTNKDGFELEFKIARTFSGNDEIIDDQSVFMIQVNRNNELQYIECMYETKNSKKHYLFNFTKDMGTYSFYFSMKKVKEEEENK